ncbi:hypothetical protein HYDPIDRAFT_38905 [Hydnomerulius pinastri MD-312]|nr:hypothetical protein HYDPIDRAFT_38905 [Hydnomerulius pinastri MD-312]
MTNLGPSALLKVLRWLLRLVTNRLCRPLLPLVSLFRQPWGAQPPSSSSANFQRPVSNGSTKLYTVAASNVPSIPVIRAPDPAATPSSSLSLGSGVTPRASVASASALHPNQCAVRMNRSGSVSSGYSSSSSNGGPTGNPGPSGIVPSRITMPTPSVPGHNGHSYPPSHAGPSTATGISQASSSHARERDLIPFGASQLSEERYDRRRLMKMSRDLPSIKALSTHFKDPRDPTAKTPWVPVVHPEGALYFYHRENHIFTDADIRRTRMSKTIENCSKRLISIAAKKGISLPNDNIEIALELKTGKDRTTKTKRCMYYLVDKNKRLLFWLHDFDPTDMYGNVKGVREPTHIKVALEMQYWTHCELYPYNRTFDKEVFYELRGIIIHANAESITSDTYLAPFEPDELSKMMDIMNVLESTTGQKNDHLMCVVARFMRMFYRVHFFNFHGQLGARLDVDQSIYETHEERIRTSVVLRIVNWLLFGAPSVHAEGIRGVWVDQTVNQPRWKAFVANVNNEWAGFTIYSTVMLAVDVSFLAVPGVVPDDPTIQPLCVVAAYVSTLCAVGSLVASVILSGQSRKTGFSTADTTVQYMASMTSTLVGIDHLAIMYSVPYGLLMWGMVSFLVALSDVIYRSAQLATLIIVGIGYLIIVVFVFWPIWGGKEKYLASPELIVKRISEMKIFNLRTRVRSSGGGHGSGHGGASKRRKGKGKRRASSVSSAGTGGGSSSGSENGHAGRSRSSSIANNV